MIERHAERYYPAMSQRSRRGEFYVLVALGLTLIYGVLVQINFAHADIVTIGAFTAYFITPLSGGSYILGIVAAIIVGGILGWLLNAAIFSPLREGGSELLPLIATIGVSIMLQNAMLLAFGPVPYSFSTPYSNHVLRYSGIFLTVQNIVIIAVSTVTIGLLYCFMKFTYLGKALRAVSQDRETAGLMGVNPNHVIMLTFVIASALAGMSGALLGPILVLTPFAGTSVIIKAFAIVIIGGFRECRGHHSRGPFGRLDRELFDPVLRPRPHRYCRVCAIVSNARRASYRIDRRKARRECLRLLWRMHPHRCRRRGYHDL